MNLQRLISLIAFSILLMTSCKNETKTVLKTTPLIAKTKKVSIAISGMTCEIGCAKTIQSKLSKKEGVTSAKVIFTDSIANIVFDANRISKKELITFINGIAGGNSYTASEMVMNTN